MNKPLIIAHRGGAKEALENTIEAFQYAISLKVPFIELDLRMTQDHKIVVFHDESTKRFFDQDIEVASSLYPDLKQLSSNRGAHIPLFKDVLACTDQKVGLMVELKEGSHPEVFVENVLEEIEGYREQLILGSFCTTIMMELKKKAPNQPRVFILDEEEKLSWIPAIEPNMIAIDLRLLSKGLVGKVKAMGVDVWVWTVNDIKGFEKCLADGADGVITDYPKRFIEQIRSQNQTGASK